MEFFSKKIISWYKDNKRDLPWRKTKDPYKIWISEIILQQTQVIQGLPYYNHFIKVFPNIRTLALADEEEVLKVWQGLGYYSRARNLHFASKQIYKIGRFPKKYEEIIELKGVGEYTAAAIASFAFKLPYAVVDGNVYRLLSRFYAINIPINTSKAKQIFTKKAQKLLSNNKPDIFNQAIMEFGSQICKAKKPKCKTCPLRIECKAYSSSKIDLFPVKKLKVKEKKLYFDYFFFKKDKTTLIKKRIEKGLWQNLYEFPLIECDEKTNNKEILQHQKFILWTKGIEFNIESISEFEHKLSHRIIHARFWEVNCKNKLPECSYIKINTKLITSYAVSRLTEKFLQSKIC